MNLSKQINKCNKTKKHVISAFGTQMSMALIQAVPQGPTGEREEGSGCFYPSFSLDRLWRDVLWVSAEGEEGVCTREGRPHLQPKCHMRSPCWQSNFHHVTGKKNVTDGKGRAPLRGQVPGSRKIRMEASRSLEEDAESKLLPPEGLER